MNAPKFEIGQRVVCGCGKEPGIIRNIFPSTVRPGIYCYGVQLAPVVFYENDIIAAPPAAATDSEQTA